MYRINDIKDALLHLVGWRQGYDPTKYISRAMTETDSGLYFQDAHPLLTLENVRSVMPEDFSMQYPNWNALLQYKRDDKVRHNGVVYRALTDNVNTEPVASDFNEDYNNDYTDRENPVWEKFDVFSDYLRMLTEQGITQMVQSFLTTKTINMETRNLLDRKSLFDGAGRIAARLQNTGKLVGFEIDPVRSMGITTKITRIGLQMYGATGNVKLHLFHSSQPEPIKTKVCNITNSNGGFQWFDLNWDLPYKGDTTNDGGSWYICYNQDDLPEWMEAINIARDWTREPCGTCNVGNAQVWREMQKYFNIMPFMAVPNNDFADNPHLWDIAKTITMNTMSYGMNIEFSVGCDITDFIIEQKAIFADVLQKQVAVNALRTIALNPDVRVNRNQVNTTRNDILYELDGSPDATRPNGLGYELKRAYKAIEIDTKGMDRVCLACHTKGIRFKTT